MATPTSAAPSTAKVFRKRSSATSPVTSPVAPTKTPKPSAKPSQPAQASKKPRPDTRRPLTHKKPSQPPQRPSEDLVTMHLRVPLSVKRATRSAAHAQGLSVSEYVAACLSVSPVQDKPSLLARLSAWCVRWFTVVRF